MSRGFFLKSEKVSKKFGVGGRAIYAVTNVDMEIKSGDRILIKGPSGAGKSTLLHTLGALLEPTGGRVTLDGRDIYRISDRKRSYMRGGMFGFVFQFFHLLPELTVLENVILPAMIRGHVRPGAIKSKAMELIEKVNMSSRINHRINQISGGEAQRVAIARALINNPDFLFCDEPTGNLDSLLSAEIRDLLISLGEEYRMGILVVSHNNIWEDFFHREYKMEDGFLSETPKEKFIREGNFIKG